MFQPPNQHITKGYQGHGWQQPPSGMNIPQPQASQQQPMMNPMMNPMMQNPMMMQNMQNMQNPMMMQNMQNMQNPNQSQPISALNIPRKSHESHRTGRKSAKSAKSMRSSARSNASNPNAPNRSLVKDLFTKSVNGRYRQVEELFARGVPANTSDEHGNTVLLIAAQNGTKKLA